MKIMFTVPGSSCAATTLAILIATTAQLSPDHAGTGSVVMVLAGVACGRLMNSGSSTPTA